MSTYTGSNQQLQYDATTGTWSLANVAQNFIDTSTFSTADPKFEYATPDDSDDDSTIDPCPLGYMLQDGACVIDPNYVPPSQVSSGGGGGGGGQPTPTPRQQSDYDLGREALESFSALKDKIDFESYDSKTKTVGLKEPENKNLLETVFTLFSPGTAIMNAVFDAKDKSDLGAAYSKNEEGEERINLQILYNDTQTKVLNPGVFEGNLYAGTPFFDNSDDTDGFYKTYFTAFKIPKEQRKFFGASSIEDIYAASEKARKAAGMFPKSFDEGYERPRSDIKYTTSGPDNSSDNPPVENSSRTANERVSKDLEKAMDNRKETGSVYKSTSSSKSTANAPGGYSSPSRLGAPSYSTNTNKSKGGQLSRESTSYKNKAR